MSNPAKKRQIYSNDFSTLADGDSDGVETVGCSWGKPGPEGSTTEHWVTIWTIYLTRENSL